MSAQSMTGEQFCKEVLLGGRTEFEDCTITGEMNLDGKKFSALKFVRCKLGDLHLKGATFDKLDLSETEVQHLFMGECNIQRIDLRRVVVGHLNLQEAKIYTIAINKTDFFSIDLTGAFVNRVCFGTMVRLKHLNLEGAKIGWVNCDEDNPALVRAFSLARIPVSIPFEPLAKKHSVIPTYNTEGIGPR